MTDDHFSLVIQLFVFTIHMNILEIAFLLFQIIDLTMAKSCRFALHSIKTYQLLSILFLLFCIRYLYVYFYFPVLMLAYEQSRFLFTSNETDEI